MLRFSFEHKYELGSFVCSVATAIVGAGALGAGAMIYGANKAASTQQGFATDAAKRLAPYNEAGQAALGPLGNLTGTGPMGAEGMLPQLQKLPGYQFQLDQGLKATQNSYAAQGLGASGAAVKGAANYAEGLAGTGIGQYYNMLYGQAGLGAGAASGMIPPSLAAGAAGAGGALGTSNAIAGFAGALPLAAYFNQMNPNSNVRNTNQLFPGNQY